MKQEVWLVNLLEHRSVTTISIHKSPEGAENKVKSLKEDYGQYSHDPNGGLCIFAMYLEE